MYASEILTLLKHTLITFTWENITQVWISTVLINRECLSSDVVLCFHKLKFLSFPLYLISFLHNIHFINLPTLIFLFY